MEKTLGVVGGDNAAHRACGGKMAGQRPYVAWVDMGV